MGSIYYLYIYSVCKDIKRILTVGSFDNAFKSSLPIESNNISNICDDANGSLRINSFTKSKLSHNASLTSVLNFISSSSFEIHSLLPIFASLYDFNFECKRDINN